MSSETPAEQNRVASKLDPGMIRQVKVPAEEAERKSVRDEVIIVSVPDLRNHEKPGHADSTLDDCPHGAIHLTESNAAASSPVSEPATSNQARPSAPDAINALANKIRQHFEHGAHEEDAGSSPRPDESAAELLAPPVVDRASLPKPDFDSLEESGPQPQQIVIPECDLPETVSDWERVPIGTEDRNAGTPSTPAVPSSLGIDETELGIFVDKIQERFAERDSIIVVFAGCEGNVHVEHTCAVVARELAIRTTDQRVLLIDADFDRKCLTDACEMRDKPGLTNLLGSDSYSIQDSLQRNSKRNLDFMSAGNIRVAAWAKAYDRAVPLFNNLRNMYRFVCVSVGDAHRQGAALWATRGDGVFMVVDMEESSRIVAQSAVDQLHSYGAHVLGCIVAGGEH